MGPLVMGGTGTAASRQGDGLERWEKSEEVRHTALP